MAILHLFCCLLGLCVLYGNTLASIATININTSKAIHTTNDKFLSTTIDSSLIYYRWEGFDFSSAKLISLSKGLAPLYWRIGGTAADHNYYKSNNSSLTDPYPWFPLTAEDWTNINTFCKKVGWRLMFDLSALIRKNDNWDPSNAQKLFEDSVKQGFADNQDFQIGNEPASFPGDYHVNISGTQLAKDYKVLQSILKKSKTYSTAYKNAICVGPEAGSVGDKLLKDFVDNVGDAVYAATFHQYYFVGKGATIDKFLDISLLDGLRPTLRHGQALVKNSSTPQMKVWLGETSSGWSGGTHNVADRYVASFCWLDKLGVSAQEGLDVVVRQAYYGRKYQPGPHGTMDYTILDNDMNPTPDYWTSYMHKQFVGQKVLNASVSMDTTSALLPKNSIRMYAHCTSTRSFYSSGGVTVFGMNLGNVSVTLTFNKEFQGHRLDWYHLTPGDSDSLLSKFMSLNGEKLQLVNDVTLPVLKPVTYTVGQKKITLEPKTLVYMVFPKFRAKACYV